MFKNLEWLFNLLQLLVLSIIIDIGYRITLVGHGLFLVVLALILYGFDIKGKGVKRDLFQDIFIVALFCIVIGNLAYFCYNFIDFKFVLDLINNFFNSKTFFR